MVAGSTPGFVAGRFVGATCGELLKRCTLELGGKSAGIVLDDAHGAVNGFHLGRREGSRPRPDPSDDRSGPGRDSRISAAARREARRAPAG